MKKDEIIFEAGGFLKFSMFGDRNDITKRVTTFKLFCFFGGGIISGMLGFKGKVLSLGKLLERIENFNRSLPEGSEGISKSDLIGAAYFPSIFSRAGDFSFNEVTINGKIGYRWMPAIY